MSDTSDRIAGTALVTGANRGIGLEWVRQLVDRVDRLYATCRTPESAQALGALAEAHPDTIHVAPLDVSDDASIETVRALVDRDTDALDLLINNAGVNGGGRSDDFASVDAETMMHTFRVNSVGPHLMARAFADLLRAADGAVIVNVTSQLGSIANTSGGTWHSYKASKAALNMLTRLQAGALKTDDVIAVAMHPGWVQTDMGGSNAALPPETSVAGMIDVIDGLTMDDTGAFLAWNGERLPW